MNIFKNLRFFPCDSHLTNIISIYYVPVFELGVGADGDRLDKFHDFREFLNLYTYRK